ncbi:hypothetical protein ACO1O0_007969 [Amphichorda felina]
MSASRALYSRGVCRLGSSLTRRPGSAAFFASLAEAPPHTGAAGGGTRPTTTDPTDQTERGLKGARRKADNKTGTQRKPRRDDGDDDAMSIFHDVVNKSAPENKPGQRKTSALGELEILADLKTLSRKQITAKQRFREFRKDVFPHIQKLKFRSNGFYLPPHLYTMTTSFLGKLAEEMISENYLANGNCLGLSRMYDALGITDLRIRAGLIMGLCVAIANEKHPVQRDKYIKNLVHMWITTSQMKRINQRGLQFALPTQEKVLAIIDGPSATVSLDSQEARWDPETNALSALFNQFQTAHGRYAIPGLLATLAAFSDPAVNPKTLVDAAPLLELVRIALTRCNVDDAFIDRVFNKEDTRFHVRRLPQLAEMVKGRWNQIQQLLGQEDATWRQGLLAAPDRQTARTKTLTHFHKLLRSAHATDNKGVIISLWQDLRAAMRGSETLVAEMRSEPEFMDFWLFVCCASKLPEMLEEAQKVMEEIGLEPTIKTYTGMMHGWKLSRDANKITAMWDSLISSRVKLDTHAWTERISGLIELGNPQKGIETLAQMLTLWKEAVKRQHVGAAVRPTIEVVNAAFRPLIRIDKKAAYDVLEWAGREGIHPNVLTYNILLSECFRDQHSDEDVQNLLKTMQEQGIQPDAATFTIILEEALGNLVDASAQQQVEAIDHVIADIKAANLKPNRETYAKMLYAVASLPNGADDAVEAVLRHMRSAGHTQISPHMVLILINRVIDRGQRNPDTIHSLLERHGFTSVHAGDQRLWEQVMSAYANLGDTKRAMALYDELRREGRPLTRSSSLRDLLLTLIEQEDLETGKRIVKDALADLEGQSMSDRWWRHHFWHQAYKYGLLDWRLAPANLRRIVDEARYVADKETGI